MPGGEGRLEVVHEWVTRAEGDFTSAEHLMKLGENTPTDIVCFHAQQCVEKYLKAMLVARGLDVPRTHNIALLLPLLPAALRPELSAAEQSDLTLYATASRYPGEGAISLAGAERAIELARRVRTLARAHLPKAALGPELA